MILNHLPINRALDNSNSLAIQNIVNNDLESGMNSAPFLDEEILIRKAFEISADAGCEYLFRKYHRALCKHALRFVKSKEKAEDVVSDVFCKFWKNSSYKKVDSSFRSYLFRSVRNQSCTHLRIESLSRETTETGVEQVVFRYEAPDEMIHYEEMYQHVKGLVDKLPPQCRKVFIMSRFEEKRYKEIAEELDLSVKTVETHLSKGLTFIRKGLKIYLTVSLPLLSIVNVII